MCFSRRGFVSTSPNPQAGGTPSSAVRGCLFNLFTATLHIGGRTSIRNLRTRHAVVTGSHIQADNIKMDLQEVEGGRGDWMELDQDMDRWLALVGTVRDLRVP